VNINVNVTGTEQVRAMLQRLGSALSNQALSETVVKVEDYIRAEAGRHLKTGALNSSIFKRRTSDGWEVGHDLQRAKHAEYFQRGTGLFGPWKQRFTVKPKNKKSLRWVGGSKFAFADEKGNPGMKPDKWIERAAAKAPQIFASAVQAHVNQLNRT
jgi:hypothetical protein